MVSTPCLPGRPINWGSAARVAFERYRRYKPNVVPIITTMETEDGVMCDERSVTEESLINMNAFA